MYGFTSQNTVLLTVAAVYGALCVADPFRCCAHKWASC
jgi:hypothetical protein